MGHAGDGGVKVGAGIFDFWVVSNRRARKTGDVVGDGGVANTVSEIFTPTIGRRPLSLPTVLLLLFSPQRLGRALDDPLGQLAALILLSKSKAVRVRGFGLVALNEKAVEAVVAQVGEQAGLPGVKGAETAQRGDEGYGARSGR